MNRTLRLLQRKFPKGFTLICLRVNFSNDATATPWFASTTSLISLAKAKAFILDGLSDGSLKPVIARTFPFEEIVEAHRFLESNNQFGKIVVTI